MEVIFSSKPQKLFTTEENIFVDYDGESSDGHKNEKSLHCWLNDFIKSQ